MPDRADRSSVKSDCGGRPTARFEPWPRISSVLPSPSAHCTAFSTSLASRALSVSVMWCAPPASKGPFCVVAFSDGKPDSTPDQVRGRPFSEMLQSKPRKIGKRQLAGPHMHAAELGAPVECRKHLAGIEQAPLVERAFEALLLGQIKVRKHRRHQIALFDPDPTLPGQHPAS